MEILNIIISVIAGVSGFFVANYFKYRSDSREEKKTDVELGLEKGGFVVDNYQKILDRYENQFKDLSNTIEKLKSEMKTKDNEIYELNLKLAELRSRVQLFENSNNDMPFPSWISDNQGKYLTTNDAYKKTFLIPQGIKEEDVIGKTMAQINPKPIADNLNKLSKLAINAENGSAMAQDMRLDNTDELYFVFMYKVYVGRTPFGTCGVAVSKKLMTNRDLTHGYRTDCENCGEKALAVKIDSVDLYKCECGWEKAI